MMKSFSLATVLATLAGCAVDRPELASNAGMSFEERVARTPREPGTNNYIVDWDIVLHGDDELRAFHERLQQGALAILAIGGTDVKWNATQKRNLTYCISNGFGARKQTVVDAMRNASDNGWEKFADVNFIYVPGEDANCTAQNINVLFDVSSISGAPYTARAFFPDDGRAARNVMIDATAFEDPAFTQILAHELGHVLGFRHEHIRPEANAPECAEDDQFRAVTTYDAASVMHYPQCNGTSTTLAFTQRDQQGVASVYGAPAQNVSPMAQVTSPANGATVGPSFEVEAQVVDTDLVKAELFIDGALYQTLTAAPFRFSVTNLAAGSHALQIKATDSAGLTDSQDIALTVDPSGGDPDVTGGCTTSGGRGGVLGMGLALAAVARRRRRRQH